MITMRYERQLRDFLNVHPHIKAAARLVQRAKLAIQAVPVRLFGLGYVKRRIQSGPLKGMWFIAGKRVYYSHWFWKGTYETTTCEFLRDTVSPNAVCYDIGANIGYHALIMAKSASSGKVYAFEPIPEVCDILGKNAAINDITNVVVVNCAAASHSGRLSLTLCPLIDQAARRESSAIGSYEELLECESVTLDDFVSQGHEPPAFLKIDVEGAEGDVLAGAERVLGQYRPQILCELHGPVPARRVYEQLTRHEYEMFCVGGAALKKIESFADVPLNMEQGHLFARASTRTGAS
jgi:FkbM family methyltransferase